MTSPHRQKTGRSRSSSEDVGYNMFSFLHRYNRSDGCTVCFWQGEINFHAQNVLAAPLKSRRRQRGKSDGRINFFKAERKECSRFINCVASPRKTLRRLKREGETNSNRFVSHDCLFLPSSVGSSCNTLPPNNAYGRRRDYCQTDMRGGFLLRLKKGPITVCRQRKYMQSQREMCVAGAGEEERN